VDRVIALINPILRGWVRYCAVGDSSRCFGFIALLTVSKKWTCDLSMTRAASGRHIFETHVNRFPLILHVHGTKPLDDLA
jgi:Group II intron, maturase-specific domain